MNVSISKTNVPRGLHYSWIFGKKTKMNASLLFSISYILGIFHYRRKMKTHKLIALFESSNDQDKCYELLYKISDKGDNEGLVFLVDLVINENANQENRLVSIEALVPHTMLGSNYYLETAIFNWLEGRDYDIEVAGSCGTNSP